MSPKQRHLLIAKLLGDLTLTNKQRAEIAQCSKRTVERVQRELQEAASNDEPILEQFQRHLREQLPVEECGKLLAEIARQVEHRPSQLAAIKRYQELLGIVTAKEAKKVETPAAPGPMLVFPADSRPILVVASPDAVDQQSSAAKVIEAEVVRVEGDENAR